MAKKQTPPSKIKPYGHNPRTITGKNDAELADSLARLGDIGVIVHDWETGEIIGGNQRSRHFDILGADVDDLIASGRLQLLQRNDKPDAQGTLAIGYLKHGDGWFAYRGVKWSKKQRQEANIRANMPAGAWDWDELANSFDASYLAKWGFDDDFLGTLKSDVSGARALTASLIVEPEDVEPQISRADELLKKWRVKSGDVWRVGVHRLLCGDSTKREDVERLMGDERANLVFADPPYGVAIGDKNKFLNSFQKAGRNLENIAGDMLGKDELYDALVKSFTLTREFMNDCCAIYVTAPQGGELGMMMMMMMMESKLPVRHVLNWVKNSPTFSAGRLDYDYQHEPILYSWKKTHKHYGGGEHRTSTWFIDKPRSSKEHPTMKPVELVVNAILNSSDDCQIVYDPFGGSGTTMLACEATGRVNRSMEISPAYCAVILERMQTAYPDIVIELDDGAKKRKN